MCAGGEVQKQGRSSMVVEIICRLFQLQGSILCTKFPELWAADSMLPFRVARGKEIPVTSRNRKGVLCAGWEGGKGPECSSNLDRSVSLHRRFQHSNFKDLNQSPECSYWKPERAPSTSQKEVFSLPALHLSITGSHHVHFQETFTIPLPSPYF